MTGSGRRGFLPDDRCLGGRREIENEWRNMIRKIYGAKSTISAVMGKPRAGASRPAADAERLSLHRARKKAILNVTSSNHINNIWHMHRRMEGRQAGAAAAAAGQATARPASAGPRAGSPDSGGRRRNGKEQQLQRELLLDGGEEDEQLYGDYYYDDDGAAGPHIPAARHSARPTSAPSASWQRGGPPAYERSSSISSLPIRPQPSPAATQDVQPIALPISSFGGPALLPSVERQLIKRTLLQEVLLRRLYRPADLRALFDAQLVAVSAPEHKYVVRQVVEELEMELGLLW